MKHRRILVALAMISFSAAAVFGNVDVYVFGKGIFTKASGAASDYKAGDNDFPLASSRTNIGMGVGLSKDVGPMFFGLETHFNLDGKTTLADPSDNDSVNIKTDKSVSGLAVVGLNVFRDRTKRIFVDIGGGITRVLGAKTRIYTSKLGYETEIEPPDSKSPFVFFGGLGLVWRFSDSMGMMIRGRYQSTALDIPERALVVMAGVTFSL